MSTESGLTDSGVSYLKARIKNLSQSDKTISVLVDEVYSAKRGEYKAGKFYGAENMEATKTLLCFMASSIGGQYRDMIAMYPLVKISADILKSTLCKVLKTLSDIGFDVVTNITDGHSANRKLYKCLGGGTLMSSIEHPANSEDTLFLLFDPVHLFKNFYTNPLRKESFKCPKVDKKSVDVCLSHVISLYHSNQK